MPFSTKGLESHVFYPIRGHLSYSAVTDITQTKNGYIWIATLKGLNRYDGYSVKSYYAQEDKLPSNCIKCLQIVDENNLLIGTDNGVALYESKRECFTKIVSLYPIYNVNSMIKYDNESIILGSDSGLYRYDILSQKLSRLSNNSVYRLTKDISGLIWAISDNSIIVYHSNGFVKYKFNNKDVFNNGDIQLSAIYIDSKGNLWCGTKYNGLFRYDKINKKFVLIKVKDQKEHIRYIRCMQEDMGGNLWIGTENGIYIYNYYQDSFEHYKKHPHGDPGYISDNAIYTIYKSREGIMWIGSYFGGVNYTSLDELEFRLITDINGYAFLKGMAVSNIIKDDDGCFWYASENNGVVKYDSKLSQITKFDIHSSPQLRGNNVHALALDPYGYMWIGNFMDGLHRINLHTMEIWNFYNKGGGKKSDLVPSNNSIYKLLADNRDSLIIGMMQGVNTFHYSTGKFTPLRADVFEQIRVDDICRDNDGELWFATHYNGIIHIDSQNQVQRIQCGMNRYPSMSSNNIYCCYRDSDNNIWFGTSDGGILCYNKKEDSLQAFGVDNELKHRDIFSIEEDTFGQLWLSTDFGIYTFDPKTHKFVFYEINDNIISSRFSANASYRDPSNGFMYFGSINGACSFQPEDMFIKSKRTYHDIILSDFKIFGQSVQPQSGSILNVNINNTQKIILKYFQNSITFEFLYIDYSTSYSIANVCEYRMLNFNNQWTIANYLPQSCTYENLTPGDYQFQVRLKDNNGKILEQRDLTVKIKSHILLSTGMIILYVFIIIIIIILILLDYNSHIKNKMTLQVEHIEKENLKKLNKHKIEFFTYISQEFKNPLMILNSIFEVKLQNNEHQLQVEDVNIMKQSIDRLLFLIKQLSEFTTIESGHTQISYVNDDIILFAHMIFNLFTPLAKQNEQKFEFSFSHEHFETYFDKDKIEKIISNLLSNAIKHSKANESIHFSININEKAKKIIILCKNTGSDIPLKIQSQIFNPFHKNGNQDDEIYNRDIELTLVNSLVTILSGRMLVNSSYEGGSKIKVELPIISRQDDARKDVSTTILSITNSTDILNDTYYILNTQNKISEKIIDKKLKKIIMLVEDNFYLDTVIKERLHTYYNILTVNGITQALNLIKKYAIDLVISDISEEDNCKLCIEICKYQKLQHIPIIVMTSKSNKEYELKCLQCGADICILKPFSIEELCLKINSLLNAQESFKRYYRDFNSVSLVSNIPSREEKFIKKLTDLIIYNLQNQELSVKFLSQELCVSKTTLYIRLKKITNLSVLEFINHVKIDISKQKLTTTNMTVQQICYVSGFNNPSYFSKIFKKITGMTPIEYKTKK